MCVLEFTEAVSLSPMLTNQNGNIWSGAEVTDKAEDLLLKEVRCPQCWGRLFLGE